MTTPQRPLSNEQVQHYEDKGFLMLPGLLDAARLTTMLDECMDAWQQEKGAFDPNATWLQNALLPDIHHGSKLVRDYYFEGPLVDIAQQLIGPNIKGVTSQLTFKMRGNTKPFGWHQDNGYGQLQPANALTTLTALDDVDPHNGCLWIIPGSHKQGQIDVSDHMTIEAKAAGADLSIEVANADEAIPVEMAAGDAVVFHCHTLHRSEGNHSRTRDRHILFLRYADADAVEVYNDNTPRLSRLLRGTSRLDEVRRFEADL
jgi:ectoine hydroxylase-related dioxygenase (phytanoyl-CoA dioxygenase family)